MKMQIAARLRSEPPLSGRVPKLHAEELMMTGGQPNARRQNAKRLDVPNTGRPQPRFESIGRSYRRAKGRPRGLTVRTQKWRRRIVPPHPAALRLPKSNRSLNLAKPTPMALRRSRLSALGNRPEDGLAVVSVMLVAVCIVAAAVSVGIWINFGKPAANASNSPAVGQARSGGNSQAEIHSAEAHFEKGRELFDARLFENAEAQFRLALDATHLQLKRIGGSVLQCK